jgi:1A family penicillin-binding protein
MPSWKRAWRRQQPSSLFSRFRRRPRYQPRSTYHSRRTIKSLVSGKLDWTRLGAWGAKAAFVGVIVAFFLALGLFAYYSRDLPSPDQVVRRAGWSTKILDRNGEPLYDVYEDQRRIPVTLDQVPETLRQATIAIEDKNFYQHSGFDLLGMLRGFTRLFTRGKAQGGSTLTQQLVKNVLLTSERRLSRKIREFVLAVQIERKYSKDEILQMYLNEAPYGGTAWGVEAAAETYFGKSVSELNLSESALLAGLPQAPSLYSPFLGGNYQGRTLQVLKRMREDGYVTEDQETQAQQDLENLQFAEEGTSFRAPHFVIYVRQLLEDRYGPDVVESGGLQVTTTLDWELQQEAQNIVSEEISQVEDLHITNGGAVVINANTGEILAMVGSKNYADPDYDGKYNVTLGLRQPGSAIKPVTYVTALKKGYTASTLLMDTATVFPGGVNHPEYQPVNYDGKYRGPVQVRYALGSSLNIPAVKMLAQVGIRDVLKTAYDMGITTLEPTQENLSRLGLSLTLGGGEVRLLEITSAYAAFGNGGYRVDPVAILKVEDRNGKVLDSFEPQLGRQVLTSQEAWIISDILSDNQARLLTFGPNSALNIPSRQVAVKTGTTNDKRDNWTIGWTPSNVVGVWVGNNDNSEMKQVASGVSGASPIWRRIILKVLDQTSPETFVRPTGITELDVDKVSGYLAHDDFPSRKEYFIAGTEPQGDDPVHQMAKICKGEQKLATQVDIARNNYDQKEYFFFKEEDPTASPGESNRWQEGILNWLKDQSDERYHPPTEYCSTQDDIEVEIAEPGNEVQINSNQVKVRIVPKSTSPTDWAEILIDGQLMARLTSPPYEGTYTLDDGPHVVQAKARNQAGKEGQREAKIGVNTPWDATPTPIPTTTPTSVPSPTLSPSPTP